MIQGTQDIYEAYFTEYLELFPITATLLGDRRWDDRFRDIYSEKHRELHRDMLQRYLSELKDAEKKSVGPSREHRAFRYALEMELEGYQYPFHLLPISQMNNIFSLMTEILRDYQIIKSASDLEALRRRMQEFQDAAYSQVECLLEGMRKGVVLPRVIADQVLVQLQTLLEGKPYLKRDLPPKLGSVYRDILESRFAPALEYTIDFIHNYYLPVCRESLGYGSLPNGNAMYDYLARLHTTLKRVSVAELHRVGLEETERVLEEKEALAETLPIKDLMGSGKFVESSREAVLEMYRKEQRRIEKRILPFDFGKMRPKRDYVIRAVPRYSEEFQTTAYYMAPSLDGRKQGTFYVNLRNLAEHPTYKREVLSLHEGNPGHHYQIALSIDMGIPKYRAYGNWNAYFEGWGLYTENLGDYRDGYGRLGKYSYELMRSIRLIVDTGLHQMGWSVERCQKLFRDTTDLVDSEIDAEIYRYIAMPAQALSYKVGELFILRARRRWLQDHGVEEEVVGPMRGERVKGAKGEAKGGEKEGLIQNFHKRFIEAGPLPLWLLGTVWES